MEIDIKILRDEIRLLQAEVKRLRDLLATFYDDEADGGVGLSLELEEAYKRPGDDEV